MPQLALQLALQLGLILATLIGLAVAVWATPRLVRSFEFRCRSNLLLAAWFFGCVVLLLYSNGTIRRTNGAVVFSLLAAGMALTAAMRRKTQKDCRQDYLYAPAHCGRCGRDLAAENQQCPRCGGAVPSSDAPIERRDWAMFWQSGWRIDYLENWRKTLALMVACIPAFAVVTVWSIYLASLPTALLAAFMALFFSMNLVRVVQYAVAGRTS
jgi:hypothetical protein